MGLPLARGLLVLLVASVAHQRANADSEELGDPNVPIPVYVSSVRSQVGGQRALITRFSPDDDYHSDWVAITGDNALPGDVSYFRAQAPQEGGSSVEGSRNLFHHVGLGQIGDAWNRWTDGSDENEDTVFTKEMHICEHRQQVQGHRLKGTLIQDSPCKRRRDTKFTFYVGERPVRGSTKLFYATCVMTIRSQQGQTDRVLYSRVSRQDRPCGSNEEQDGGAFYAFSPKLRCAVAREPDHGHIEQRSFGQGHLVSGVTFQCDLGYDLRGQSSMTCGSNGRWEGRIPTCSKSRCRSPDNISHGQVQSGDFGYGDYASYECDAGYELYPVGARIQCQARGQWTDAGAECNRRSCGFPGVIDNGDIMGSGFEYQDHVTFTCDEGYRLIGQSEATCQASGQWSNQLPRCQQITCPQLPHPAHGVRTETSHAVNAEVLYRCEEGYLMDGSASIRCLQDGTQGRWSDQPPTCQRIECPEPVRPTHGSVLGSERWYGQEIGYVCDEGYRLEGSDRAMCGQAGWDTPPPTCTAIACSAPITPDHAILTPSDTDNVTMTFNDFVVYECEEGYVLDGAEVLRCEATGRWNNMPPVCNAMPCATMGTPENGAREGDDFVYGQDVSFSCFPGYLLVGSEAATCQADGTWTHPQPVCSSCPRGTYKERGDTSGCVPCPAHSNTTAPASTSPLHCVCQAGTTAREGGTCQVIECEPLEAPAHGSRSECQTVGGAECVVSCDPGYTLTGNAVRRCTAEGWSGIPAQCKACAGDTYQESQGSGSCLPCPRHSATTPGQPATSRQDCVCQPGYVGPPGGPCQDVDECALDNGGCNQTCTNVEGGYLCTCDIPGHTLDQDGTSCVLTETCPSFDTAPGNGYLQCQQTPEHNAALCHIKCHPGYFFVSGINNYVTCGPDSHYKWSHRLLNSTARIPTCTREFFVDVNLPMTFKYHSGVHCNTLPIVSADMNTQIQQAIETLNVCRKQCDITSLNITCNDLGRGDNSHQTEITIDFEVLVQNPSENAVSLGCDPMCKRRNMREMLSEAFGLKTAVENLVKTMSTELQISDLPNTQLQSNSFEYSRPQILCEDGRVLTKNRLCAPCDAGYYLPSRELKSCLPCPIGTYQDTQGQTSCKPCLEGATTLTGGSDHPTMCSVRITQINAQKSSEMVNENVPIAGDEVQEDEVDDILSVL